MDPKDIQRLTALLAQVELNAAETVELNRLRAAAAAAGVAMSVVPASVPPLVSTAEGDSPKLSITERLGALASSRTKLAADLQAAQSRVTELQGTLAARADISAEDLTILESKVIDLEASLASEQNARTTAEQGLETALDQVKALEAAATTAEGKAAETVAQLGLKSEDLPAPTVDAKGAGEHRATWQAIEDPHAAAAYFAKHEKDIFGEN